MGANAYIPSTRIEPTCGERVLALLARLREPRTSAELAGMLGLRSSNVIDALSRLESAGLVSVEGAKRARAWRATEKGRAA